VTDHIAQIGLSCFRVRLSCQNDYDSPEKYFNELFGIQKTLRNSRQGGCCTGEHAVNDRLIITAIANRDSQAICLAVPF